MGRLFVFIGLVWFAISTVAMSYTLTINVIENQVAAYAAFITLVIIYLTLGYILRNKLIYRNL